MTDYPTTDLLIAHDVQVQRGDLILCDGIAFSLAATQVLHIVGRNGVGKSTLLLMLAGVLPVHSGQLLWSHRQPERWSTLYIGHKLGLSPSLSVLDNIGYLLRLDGQRDVLTGKSQHNIDKALAWAGLSAYQHQLVEVLSAGQRRRLQLARLHVDFHAASVAYAQRLWLLDEPLTALDSAFSDAVQVLMLDFVSAGGRLVLTSHQPLDRLRDAEVMCVNMESPAYQSQDMIG